MSKRERIEDLGVAMEKMRIILEDTEVFDTFKLTAPIEIFGNAWEDFDKRYMDRQHRYMLYLSLYNLFSQLDSIYNILLGDVDTSW